MARSGTAPKQESEPLLEVKEEALLEPQGAAHELEEDEGGSFYNWHILRWGPRRDSWRRKIILMLMLVLLMLMLMVWPLKSNRGSFLSTTTMARSSTHGSPLTVRPWNF